MHTLTGVAGFNFRSIQGGRESVMVIVPYTCTDDVIDMVEVGRDGFVGGNIIVAFFSSFSSR